MRASSPVSHCERRCHARLVAAQREVPQQKKMCRPAESGVFSRCASLSPIVVFGCCTGVSRTCVAAAFVGRAGRTFDALDSEGGDFDSVGPTPPAMSAAAGTRTPQ